MLFLSHLLLPKIHGDTRRDDAYSGRRDMEEGKKYAAEADTRRDGPYRGNTLKDCMVGGDTRRDGLYSGREDTEGRTVRWEGTHGGMECTVVERGDTGGWNCTVEGQTVGWVEWNTRRNGLYSGRETRRDGLYGGKLGVERAED